MVNEFGVEYSSAKLKLSVKLNGRYVADLNKETLDFMNISYRILAKPFGIALEASWKDGATELFIPYYNVEYLVK